MCLWDCFPPSEVPVVTGVVLGVGLSIALVTLVFFLHSNATWSLHSLWQFMPQSERQREREREAKHAACQNRNRRRSWLLYWLFFEDWSALQMQIVRALQCLLSSKQIGRGRGGKTVVLAADCVFFFFAFHVCRAQLTVCNVKKREEKNHRTPSQDSVTSTCTPQHGAHTSRYLHASNTHTHTQRQHAAITFASVALLDDAP